MIAVIVVVVVTVVVILLFFILPGDSAPPRASGKKGILKFAPKIDKTEKSAASLSAIGDPDQCENSSARDNGDASEILSSNLHPLKLDKKSKGTRKMTSAAEYKPEKWVLSEEEGCLSQLNLAIVGHVDSGKSTLSGRLLHLLGMISKKVMHKNEKEAKEKGKGSFTYAWAMDESTVAYFKTEKYRVVLLDSPGHKDFVPNMISGVTQADAAILVVDASIGSFEAGLGGNGFGQTREHAQLIRSFGVEQIIIAVNKMDVVEYSRGRFDDIKVQLGSFLRSYGFKESNVTWVPLSVMENQNLISPASDVRLTCWYEGCYLLDAIDSLQSPPREVSKPLLLPICDGISSHSLGQVAACGKLERGALRSGSKVLVMPSGDLATIRAIERDSSPCSVARAGDNVAVSLQGIDGGHVIPGGVLCLPDFPVTVASTLELKILVLAITAPILIGSQVEFHIHHARTAAKVVKILSLIDPKSGKSSKRPPRLLTAKQSAIIEVSLDEAVCVEAFSECRVLGRVILRAAGNTIAVGIVTRVIEPET
ncbi:HBS1-like protein isoform X1 [Asparagus officinalis]|uniref:HBS1-like protein isoform X1 n=1 Tax=Asparagus officinalis TaxID=4686 RepID=UPI00098E67C7|nr:HBS1-like protein isoform X1 [Asparagus officinalis]XP_020275715.1 HBS1-like protein isoform X1 [Asparagus officinalis]